MTSSILFLGASITAAYGIDISLSYPKRIGKYLMEMGKNYNILNAAVPGASTDQGLLQLRSYMKEKNSISHIIIALGLADGLYGFEPEVVKNNLQNLIQEIREFDPNIMIFQIQGKLIHLDVLPNYSESYSRDYENVFINIAKENNVVLLPFFLEGVAMNQKYTQADSIHPNEEGMEIITQNVWTSLKDYF